MRISLLTVALAALPLAAIAQDDTAAPAAPHPLEAFYGTWSGTASGTSPTGEPFTLTQTERVGPMLGGEVAVIEGRGYADDGSLEFNAFAVVSCFTPDVPCELRSYSDGRAGTFELTGTETGFDWMIPIPGGASVTYKATIEDGTWREVGHYHPADGEPRKFIEMELTRTGDTDWPAGGALTLP